MALARRVGPAHRVSRGQPGELALRVPRAHRVPAVLRAQLGSRARKVSRPGRGSGRSGAPGRNGVGSFNSGSLCDGYRRFRCHNHSDGELR